MSRKNVYKLNSKHLINDDSDDDYEEVDWSVDTDNENDNVSVDMDDMDEMDDIDNELDEILLKQKHIIAEPEINIEVVTDKKTKEKAVKVSIDLELENETNDIINIDFTINKNTFLKIAKQLK